MTKSRFTEEEMAKRVGLELTDGSYVNLGIGLPLLVSNHIQRDRKVYFQCENGILGAGPHAKPGEGDVDLSNAGDDDIIEIPGASYFDSCTSFAMIRGGHLDACVLGAYQVSERGDLANWKLPERKVGGFGGALDLAMCAKKVIVLMKHTTDSGNARIVEKCSYPITAARCVDTIVTDLAVIDVTYDGLVLREVVPGWTVEEVEGLTQAKLITNIY